MKIVDNNMVLQATFNEIYKVIMCNYVMKIKTICCECD